MLKKFVFSIFIFTVLPTFALDPRLDYEKMQSEHFHVIFDAKSYEDAKRYLQEAERSHKILAQLFGVEPSFTVVLLEPDIDMANGAATGVPRPMIYAHLQPPTPLSSVNYFSDWPQDVFLHEYAHVLNMEPANGVFAPLRWIFGSFVRPNMYLPRWYLEGLAVEMESRFNETGRLKSEDYDALIRALLLDGKWGTDNLSAINETTTPSWPQGQRPYFYGALIWHEIYQKKGPSVVKRLNERYGGRFPYFISAPIEDEMGKDYSGILQDIYTKYRTLALAQIENLKKEKVTIGKRIVVPDAIFQHSPSISPNGELLAFVSADTNADSFIYLLRKDGNEFSFNGGTRLRNVKKDEIQKIAWFPNSDLIVFDAIDTFDRVKYVFDLYTYNIAANTVDRLTKGERAREPAVSPDGKTIVFIKADRGSTSLQSLDVATKKISPLYKPALGVRLSRPNFVNANTLVLAVKKPSGEDEIRLFDLSSQQFTKSLTTLKMSSQPTVTSDGIIFTSTDSGVENLYWVDKNLNGAKPLTNTLTRVINGAFDSAHNTVYYADLTGDGVFLKKAPSQNLKSLPRVQHPIKGDFEKITKEISTVKIPEREDYWALRYMFPQYWIPFVTATQDGTLTSITIPGSDARGHHLYSIQGLYDSRPGEWSAAFNYGWINSLGFTTFSVSDVYTYYNSLERTTNDEGASVLHAFPIPGLSNDFSALLGFDYEKVNIATSSTTDVNHYMRGPTVGFGYSNLQQKAAEIAPAGQNMNLKFTKYLPNNTDTEYNKTMLHLSHHHSKWLPKRHRLALSFTGVHSERNRSILLGTTSSDTPILFGPETEGFYLRGYPPGEFIGYSMALGKIEYKFPLADVYSGPDSPIPVFIKRLHGEIFTEALTLRGIYFEDKTNLSKRTDLGTFFTSAGAEVKLDMTILYHLPVTFVTGGALGLTSDAQGEFRMYTQLQSPLLF